MNIRNLKKTLGISLIALTFVFAAAGVSSAQNDRDRHDGDRDNNMQQGDR